MQVFVTMVKWVELSPVIAVTPVVSVSGEEFVNVTVLLAVELVNSDPNSTGVDDAVIGVTLFCTANLAFRIPAPQFCLRLQSYVAKPD